MQYYGEIHTYTETKLDIVTIFTTVIKSPVGGGLHNNECYFPQQVY